MEKMESEVKREGPMLEMRDLTKMVAYLISFLWIS